MSRALGWLVASLLLSAGASAGPLPKYRLDIDADAQRELDAYLESIRELTFLPPGRRLWVPATFRHQESSYPVRLRIRGDISAHWKGERRSYRLRFVERLFEGKREINLILPWDKHYGVELLQTRVAEDLGLAWFPGRFVELELNGADQGLYYENEHPTREYLERTGRPASSIFTFASNWTLYLAAPYHHVFFARPGSASLPPVEGVGQIKQRGTWEPNDPRLARRQHEYAVELFDLLDWGDVAEVAGAAGRYLDLDNFARYVALQDFFGSTHGIGLNDNTRLYLDPTSGKFEFMPWDTRMMPLADRLEDGDAAGDLLAPRDPLFRKLFRAFPAVEARRDAVLRGLVEKGGAYRAELRRIHAGLIERHPEDARLARESARLDRLFGENLAILEQHLSRPHDAR